MATDRGLLALHLRRLSGAKTAATGLPALPPATPISAAEGKGTEGATAAQTGAGGLSLGAASTVTVTSSDGLLVWQLSARDATDSTGATVKALVVG